MHVPLSALRRPSARCALKAKWRYQTGSSAMQGAPLHTPTWRFSLDKEIQQGTCMNRLDFFFKGNRLDLLAHS